MVPGSQQDSPSTAGALSPHGGLGPPPPRPLTKKRPHRRSPQARDECRLRKRACDAVDPCRPCERGGLSTYSSTACMSESMANCPILQNAHINSDDQCRLPLSESGICKII